MVRMSGESRLTVGLPRAQLQSTVHRTRTIIVRAPVWSVLPVTVRPVHTAAPSNVERKTTVRVSGMIGTGTKMSVRQ